MEKYQSDVVSIIIPTYNNEKFILKCINSVKNQTYKKCQIIVVIDGSTDNTEKIIVNNFSSNDILLLKKENGGLSSARNFGLQYANGEYIFFLDGDDYLEKDAIENLINKIDDNDIVIGRYRYITTTGKFSDQKIPIQKEFNIKNISSNELFLYLFNPGFGLMVCNKIIRRKIIDDSLIKFQPNDVIYAEDLLFNSQLINFLKKAKIIENVTYNYLKNELSITQTYKEKLSERFANLINYYEKLEYKRKDLSIFLACNAVNTISAQENSLKEINKKIKLFNNLLENKINFLYSIKYLKDLPNAYKLDYGITCLFINRCSFLVALYQYIKRKLKNTKGKK